MKLVADWRDVIRHAWSIRLMLLAGLLSGLEAVLPLIPGLLPIPVGIFAAISLATVAAAFIARIVAQQPLSGDKK